MAAYWGFRFAVLGSGLASRGGWQREREMPRAADSRYEEPESVMTKM
jgi:hypothetical protein